MDALARSAKGRGDFWTFEHLLVILGMTLAVAAPSPMAPGLNDPGVYFVRRAGCQSQETDRTAGRWVFDCRLIAR